MNGTKLIFDETGPRLDLGQKVTGFDSMVQNCLVNIGTHKGSDPLFPDRGTTLFQDGLRGRLVSEVWARHDCNFAALDTLAFAQVTDAAQNEAPIQKFSLTIKDFEVSKLRLSVFAESAAGEPRGNEYLL